MTQTAHEALVEGGFEIVGTGQNVYEKPGIVEGTAKWLETPQDVMDFVASGDVSDVIVIARGGTTTFLTMALNAGIRGVITLQGAPESHLGIISREYGVPAIMSVTFRKGVRTERGETVPADGTRIRLDVSSRPEGVVSIEPGAPVDDSPAPESATPAMSPEQLAQIILLLEKFGGEIPHGAEGDQIMQAEMKTRVLYLDDDESLRRPVTREEVNEAIRYYTWNEWDALAARATEGESGLIPRQEYEAMGIANCWFKHPVWLRAIEDRIGIDGIIKVGEIGRKEIGSKINMLNIWAMATAPSFGRGIAVELGLHDFNFRADRITDTFSTVRRLYKGLWQSGPILTSMKGYKGEVLERSWVDRFVADRIDLSDPKDRETFVRFNGAAELMGFLLHFDNRTGVSDHGPYPLEDGGFILARDVFLNEPAWPWNDPASPLPWSVTIAMSFAPGTPLEVQVVDISTVFTKPANYLQYIESVSVYVRDTWDAPMDTVRTLTLADMTRLQQQCADQSAQLYARIAGMTKREKIEAGALTYSAGFALPFARAAGMVDELVADYDFTGIHPSLDAVYDTVISGVATEMIPRLFLTGSWGNPVPETASEHLSAQAQQRFRVFHSLAVRGFATAEQIAESSGIELAEVQSVLSAAVESGHAIVANPNTGQTALTPTGKGAYILLREVAIEDSVRVQVSVYYERFLAPNQKFKQLVTDWQLGSEADPIARLDAIHDEISAVIDGLAGVDNRFAHYGTRLTAAADSFRAGNRDAFAKPLSDSYHDVWMELHEDLLATTSSVRSEADG